MELYGAGEADGFIRPSPRLEGIRGYTYGIYIKSCSSASLLRKGWLSSRCAQVFCTTFVPELGSVSFRVLIPSNSIG